MQVFELNGSKEGVAKFLVVNGRVYLTEIVDAGKIIPLTHPELGKKESIHDEILRLRNEDPSLVCGGLIIFDRLSLTISCDSSGYKLPVIDSAAEQHAVEAFQRIIAPGIVLKLSNGKQYPQNARLMLD